MPTENLPLDEGRPDTKPREEGEVRKPSILDLLTLPWTFTQRSLLSPGDFERECDRRGISLFPGQLEALDRAGILSPIIEIDASLGAYPVRSGTSSTKNAIADGRIRPHAPNSEGSWPRGPSAPFSFGYSFYQLLGLPQIRPYVALLRLQEGADRNAGLRWEVAPDPTGRMGTGPPQTPQELIVWLSLLDPVFAPRIRRQMSMPFLAEIPDDRTYGPEEFSQMEERYRASYLEYRRTVPRRELLDWLRTTPEDVARYAVSLLITADNIDPLGVWLEVIRLAPAKWDDLRNDALIALDHRIAAEMLLSLLEDLAKDGDLDAAIYSRSGTRVRGLEPSRLVAEEARREGVLLDFDLSPHPICLVVIEGDTEQEIAPLVMTELEIPPPPWPIRLHNSSGVDSNLTWLYRYAWAFDVHEEIYGGFRPSRPLPHIFILSDPEGRRQTASQREAARQKIIRRLRSDAESIAGRKLPGELFETRVRLTAWPASFEFSHFETGELADGIRVLEPTLDSQLEGELIEERSASLPRISAAWHRLRLKGLVTRDLDKRALARALWPALQSRIRAAGSDEIQLRQLPLVGAMLDAYDAVASFPWGHFTYVPAGRPPPDAEE